MELVCTNPELAREYAESRAVVGPFRRDRIRDCLVPYLHWHPLSGAMHSEGNVSRTDRVAQPIPTCSRRWKKNSAKACPNTPISKPGIGNRFGRYISRKGTYVYENET
jgi:hypothetical protein